jgi:hypothetical protein
MRVHFSTDDVSPRDREGFFIDLVTKYVMKVTPGDRPDPATYRAEFDAHAAGGFTLFGYQTPHLIGLRTAADVGRDKADTFQFRRVPHEYLVHCNPTPRTTVDARCAAGDFYVSSNEWPADGLMKGGISASGLVIPHGVLSPLVAGGRLTRPVVIAARSPLGSLLEAVFGAVNAQVPRLSPELGEAVLYNLCGLVALACGASEEGRSSVRDSLRAARLEAQNGM